MRKLTVFLSCSFMMLGLCFAQDAPKVSKQRKPTLTAHVAPSQPLDVQIAKLEQKLAVVQQQANPNPANVAKLQATIADKKTQLAAQQATAAKKAAKK
ncbi:MAG: ABC transporter C-terminal domain-containing protein [Bacteroidia bacterium]